MKKSEYEKMYLRESTYWWHVGRLQVINTYLSGLKLGSSRLRILNVGCGTGGNMPIIEKYGEVKNIDVSKEAIMFMKKSGYEAELVDGPTLPFSDNSYDMVVALDVLEHIDKDKSALVEWLRVLKPNGVILFTVPAYQWLWSDHDVSLHHYRRYTKTTIKKITPVGAVVQKISYFIVFSLPLVVGFRVINKLLRKQVDSETSYVNVPKVINAIFIKLLAFEAVLHRFFGFPVGTSIITIMRKK